MSLLEHLRTVHAPQASIQAAKSALYEEERRLRRLCLWLLGVALLSDGALAAYMYRVFTSPVDMTLGQNALFFGLFVIAGVSTLWLFVQWSTYRWIRC